MHKSRNLVFLIAITGVMMACSFGGAVPAAGDNVATIVASTLQALTPSVATVAVSTEPAATATSQVAQPQGIPVNYRNVSFVLPIGLATDAAPSTVPAKTEIDGGPWDSGPEHIQFRLDGYSAPANSFSVVRIDVYPAAAYASANTGANISLQRLQGLLANPSTTPVNSTMPQVPYFNAASMLLAQVQRMHFANGDGVRALSQYGQAVNPVGNYGLFYEFHGLTSDGKFYIIMVLPVQASFLQSGPDPSAGVPPGGIPFPGYENMGNQKVYDDYYGAIAAKLDATPAGDFSPSLAALDALVQSFKVTP